MISALPAFRAAPKIGLVEINALEKVCKRPDGAIDAVIGHDDQPGVGPWKGKVLEALPPGAEVVAHISPYQHPSADQLELLQRGRAQEASIRHEHHRKPGGGKAPHVMNHMRPHIAGAIPMNKHANVWSKRDFALGPAFNDLLGASAPDNLVPEPRKEMIPGDQPRFSGGSINRTSKQLARPVLCERECPPAMAALGWLLEHRP